MADGRCRAFDETTDLDAVLRIWIEVGWLEDDSKREALAAFMSAGHVEVGLLDGEPECAVHWTPGTIDHTGTPLGLCAITAVTTSLIGRKQGLASTLTASALRQGAEAGHAVAALGMFEQGFYDRVGFGTAAYDTFHRFDPGRLVVDDVPYRTPVRLGRDDWAEMHAAMVSRLTSHGSVSLTPPSIMEGEAGFLGKPYGLGYRAADGTLTHFVFGEMQGEHGPFVVGFMAYRSPAQLRELLRLLRELGDQVHTVRLKEPAHVQLQALLSEPFRDRLRTKSSPHEAGSTSVAWWQLRMLDVPACVSALAGVGEPVEFVLRLTDPVADRLADGTGWDGAGGDYTVVVGPTSHAERGSRSGLPVLEASVNAFTRMWFGVRPVSGLVATDDLAGPDALIDALDRAIRLPEPHPGWSF